MVNHHYFEKNIIFQIFLYIKNPFKSPSDFLLKKKNPFEIENFSKKDLPGSDLVIEKLGCYFDCNHPLLAFHIFYCIICCYQKLFLISLFVNFFAKNPFRKFVFLLFIKIFSL